MLLNNLDPEVAEHPERLVVYGGSGRAARSHEALKDDRPHAPAPPRRRDAARPERQAGRGLPHGRVGAARAHRELAARAAVGDLGRVPAARGRGPDDVRPDDRRQLDLHRHAGDPPGHVPDVRGRRRAALRVARPQRADDPHGRARRDGRRAAARGDDGRRGDPLRRGRPEPDRATARDALPRRGRRLARRRARPCAGAAAEGRALSVGLLGERRDRLPGARRARRALRPRHRPDRGARPAHGLRAGRGAVRGGGGAARARPRRVPPARARVDRRARPRDDRVRPGGLPRLRLRQQPAR